MARGPPMRPSACSAGSSRPRGPALLDALRSAHRRRARARRRSATLPRIAAAATSCDEPGCISSASRGAASRPDGDEDLLRRVAARRHAPVQIGRRPLDERRRRRARDRRRAASVRSANSASLASRCARVVAEPAMPEPRASSARRGTRVVDDGASLLVGRACRDRRAPSCAMPTSTSAASACARSAGSSPLCCSASRSLRGPRSVSFQRAIFSGVGSQATTPSAERGDHRRPLSHRRLTLPAKRSRQAFATSRHVRGRLGDRARTPVRVVGAADCDARARLPADGAAARARRHRRADRSARRRHLLQPGGARLPARRPLLRRRRHARLGLGNINRDGAGSATDRLPPTSTPSSASPGIWRPTRSTSASPSTRRSPSSPPTRRLGPLRFHEQSQTLRHARGDARRRLADRAPLLHRRGLHRQRELARLRLRARPRARRRLGGGVAAQRAVRRRALRLREPARRAADPPARLRSWLRLRRRADRAPRRSRVAGRLVHQPQGRRRRRAHRHRRARPGDRGAGPGRAAAATPPASATIACSCSCPTWCRRACA